MVGEKRAGHHSVMLDGQKDKLSFWVCARRWRQSFMTKQCACNSTRTNEPHKHTPANAHTHTQSHLHTLVYPHTHTHTYTSCERVKECEKWSTKTDSHKDAPLCCTVVEVEKLAPKFTKFMPRTVGLR